jgi:hypothetical protein
MRSWIASLAAIRPYRHNGGPNASAPGRELTTAPGSKKDATDALALSADVSAAYCGDHLRIAVRQDNTVQNRLVTSAGNFGSLRIGFPG